MNKFAALFAGVLIISILILPSVSAVQVTDIQTGVQTANDQLAQMNASLTAKINALSESVGKMPNKDELTGLLTAQSIIIQQQLEVQKSQIIVGFIIGCICTIGVFFGIYFWFKGAGRI